MTLSRGWLLPVLFGGVCGCRGYLTDSGWTESCDARSLEEGQVRARRIPCDDEAIEGGDARRADYLLENAVARYGVRHPGAPLTLLGTGGGTLIDAATPGGEDTLAELVPLVEGGWLCETTLELEQGEGSAAIHVHGVPCPVTFLDWSSPASDVPITITYRLEADSPVLTVEGHQGAWLLPVAGAQASGATLRVDGSMLAMDGQPLDYGGGVYFDGGQRLAVGEPTAVHAALWPGGGEVAGTCAGDGVELLGEGSPVGWLPVDDDGEFSGAVPAGTDALRALAEGHGEGPSEALGTDLDLPLGQEGWVYLRVLDRGGEQLPARLTAVDGHGRRSLHAVPAEGGALGLGGGHWELQVDAGPLYTRHRRTLEELSGEVHLDVELGGTPPPAGWVLADLSVETWPSRTDRRAPADALALVAAAGVGFGVVSAEDEVATAALDQPWDGRIRAVSGSTAQSDGQGRVLAWPVSASRRKPAHGAVDWRGLSARDLLRVAAGSDNQDRLLAVDATWLEMAGPSHAWDPWPRLFVLDSLEELDQALTLFDGWVDVALAGPLTWAWIGHDERYASVDVERALVEGHTVATTGPLLELELEGVGPGNLLQRARDLSYRLVVHAPRDVSLEGAALVVDGEWRRQWDLSGKIEEPRLVCQGSLEAERYVVAVAWGPHREGDPAGLETWAVTTPIWTGRP